MRASLMMYARPELEAEQGRYWALIRAALADHGIAAPQQLATEAEDIAHWLSPDLVFSQTCGLPFRTRLADQVTLIGTPDYGLRRCPPGYYQSVMLVREDDPRSYLSQFRDARFVYNQTCSQSGYAAAWSAARAEGFWFTHHQASGSHFASARAVAQDRADIAFVDAQTWRLLKRYEGFANRLRAHMWTTPTPGLPYIAAKGADGALMFEAVSQAITALTPLDREALCIERLVAIPGQDYLAVETPPDHDC